jgi:hypothetical protein
MQQKDLFGNISNIGRSPKGKPKLDRIGKLLRKIENLKAKKETTRTALDAKLRTVLEIYLPEMSNYNMARRELVDMLVKYLNNGIMKLPDQELAREYAAITIEAMAGWQPIDDDLRAIYLTLTGRDFGDYEREERMETIHALKDEMENLGLDLDMDDLNLDGDDNDLLNQVKMKMKEAAEKELEAQKTRKDARKKTKGQIDKETATRLLEEAKTKGMAKIYKDLAKLLHPDLERDPGMRQQKEDVMKELTKAYESDDLFTLIKLEQKWLEKNQDATGLDRELLENAFVDQLKIQIKQLEMEEALLDTEPRYAQLARLREMEYRLTLIDVQERLTDLKDEYNELKNQLDLIRKAKGPFPRALRDMLAEFRMYKKNYMHFNNIVEQFVHFWDDDDDRG